MLFITKSSAVDYTGVNTLKHNGKKRINRTFHLQRSSNERPRMSFKTVPCMPVCAVTGHIRAFGSRSVQPAFSPVTNRNKSEGPCFSFQPPEFHLLYLKRRETWCHKPLLLLAQRSKGQETSVLQANPRELRDAQHGISSVQ